MRRGLALALVVLAVAAWLLAPGAPPSPTEIRLRQAVPGKCIPKDADGYRFGAVLVDENGMPLDLKRRFACWAVPEGKGRTYLVDETGTVYGKDTGGEIPRWWPASDPTSKGWIAITP